MKAPDSLFEMQRLMRAAMVGEPAPGLDALILRTRGGVSVRERLAVYNEAWFARLQESLIDDYDCFFALQTSETAEKICRDYVHAYPSSSYTLAHLGNHLPEYLRSERLAPQWQIELAEIERSLYLSQMATDPKPWDMSQLQNIAPEDVETIRLRLSGSAFLHAHAHDVRPWLKSSKKKAPKPREMAFVVHRLGFNARVSVITSGPFEFLNFIRGGATLGDLADKFPSDEWPVWLRELSELGLIELI